MVCSLGHDEYHGDSASQLLPVGERLVRKIWHSPDHLPFYVIDLTKSSPQKADLGVPILDVVPPLLQEGG